jgi:hypothetical protein
VGANATTAFIYSDNITAASVASGGSAGVYISPTEYASRANGKVNLRLRTSSSANKTVNAIAQWDFAFASIQWVEDVEHQGATAWYTPSGVNFVSLVTLTRNAVAVPAAEGVYVGDNGLLSDDNFHSGRSIEDRTDYVVNFSNVQERGANKIIIQTEFDLDVSTVPVVVQICDWVSSVSVDHAADTHCTGGGWRTLNINGTTITSTTPTAYHWEVYDGYWNSDVSSAISTPIPNFISSGGDVKIRYYSGSTLLIDYARIAPVVSPVYSPAQLTQISGGTVLGDYSLAAIGGAGQTGSDNAYVRVPGTAGSVSDFYFSYKNVKIYPGANTILFRAEYSCSTTGITHRPKIYNFNTLSWEDLTTASIACSATDATNAWAKSNVTISNYISNGEIRVGWRGLANGTQEIRLDVAYVMIGTVTDGTSQISFGSNSSGSALDTRTLDMTGTSNIWNIQSADESNTLGFSIYGNDNDNDATVEEASAANIDFTLQLPERTFPTGIFFAGRYRSGTAGTVQLGIRDYRGFSGSQGGWSQIGANGTTALVYSDNITLASVLSGGAGGFTVNPIDHMQIDLGKMNMRLRTSASGATTNNSIAQWDFAMVSLQWVEVPPEPQTITFSISDNTVGFGSLNASQTRYATGGGGGSTLEATAHSITASSNAPGGYIVTVDGQTLTYGSKTVDPAGGTPVAPTAGIEQFGIGVHKPLTLGAGFGLLPYTSGFAFDPASFPSPIVANYTDDNIEDTYEMIYMANISADTDAGDYAAVVTYTATATF